MPPLRFRRILLTDSFSEESCDKMPSSSPSLLVPCIWTCHPGTSAVFGSALPSKPSRCSLAWILHISSFLRLANDAASLSSDCNLNCSSGRTRWSSPPHSPAVPHLGSVAFHMCPDEPCSLDQVTGPSPCCHLIPAPSWFMVCG